MPTLFTALRTHVPAVKAAKQQPSLQPYGLEMMVSPKILGKKKKERVYKLSLKQRFRRINKSRATREIVVIGAGLAGLSAAYELSSVGYKVTVLEGQKRVGGRVETLRKLIPGRVTEGGAELIGSNHHAWLSYKHKFHLHFTDVLEPPNAPVILGGFRLSSAEAAVLGAEFLKATGILDREARSINAGEPWLSPKAPGARPHIPCGESSYVAGVAAVQVGADRTTLNHVKVRGGTGDYFLPNGRQSRGENREGGFRTSCVL